MFSHRERAAAELAQSDRHLVKDDQLLEQCASQRPWHVPDANPDNLEHPAGRR